MISNIEEYKVKNIYDIIASHFNNTRVYTWKWLDDFMYSLSKNSVILDIGCGNGRNMNFNNYHFIGLDNCNKFLKICNNKNLNVIEANMKNIPIVCNICDAIICIAVFHHLSSFESRIESLYEMKRVLRKDGLLLLSVWSINQPKKINKYFNKYGDTIVPYNKFGVIYERYYYIFRLEEIVLLFKIVNLKILSYCYSDGNEIFILQK